MGYQLRLSGSTTIINNVSSIENTTGRTATGFALGSAGCDAFMLELTMLASGTDDGLTWELRPNSWGAATYATQPLKLLELGAHTSVPSVVPLSGTIANISGAAETHQYVFSGVPADSVQLYVASGGATDTWTVTAKVRTLKYG